MEEEMLQDVRMELRPSEYVMKASSFAMCLASPVMHRMLCGRFREGSRQELVLEDVSEHALRQALALWSGKVEVVVSSLTEAIEVGRLAERLQMEEVRSVIEDIVVKHLTVAHCAEVLSASQCSGLFKVEERSICMALELFEEVAKTNAYLRLSEEILGNLLEDDRLTAEGEYAVLEAALRWMKVDWEPRQHAEGLLKRIRFGLMEEDELEMASGKLMEGNLLLRELVREARLVKADRSRFSEMFHLSGKALQERSGLGLRWTKYAAEGRDRKLTGHRWGVTALAACEGRVCSGSYDGTVRVWRRSSLETERLLGVEGASDVLSLAWWEGRLVSGHSDGRLRVWDLGSERCEQELEGHTSDVLALAASGDLLASGSADMTVRVWRREGRGECVCEWTLRGHPESVMCLATWEGKVISGSVDKTIRVWDASSGAHDRTLKGHTGWLSALAAAEGGRRLLSAASDGTVRTWGLGTWEPLQMMQVYPVSSKRFVRFLAVSRGGGKLMTGSSSPEEAPVEVKVWNVDTLECTHTLVLAAVSEVRALAVTTCGKHELWGGVGSQVVVWGHST